MQAFFLSAQFARESAMLKLPEETNTNKVSPTQNTPAQQARCRTALTFVEKFKQKVCRQSL